MTIEPNYLPLTTDGCPPPGPDFIAQAMHLGDPKPKLDGRVLVSCGPVLEDLYRRATYEPDFYLNVAVKQTYKPALCVLGHLWDATEVLGPRPAPVMVVGKWPGNQEIQHGRNLVGESGVLLGEALESLGCSWDEVGRWYVTNLVKHAPVDPTVSRVSAAWEKNWLPVLFQELAWVRPKVVLCLGQEAAQAVLRTKLAVKDALGRTFETLIPAVPGEEAYKASVAVVMHPAAVARAPEQTPFLVDGLRHFLGLVRGDVKKPERPKDWRVVYTESELASVVDLVLERAGPAPVLVFDSEWHGEHPCQTGSYLRTVQFTDKARFACCVVLRHQGGEEAFLGGHAAAVRELRRLVTPRNGYKPRIAGHHLRADLPWIYHHLDRGLGELLIQGYLPAPTPERARFEGGLDTMLIAHAYRETGFFEGFKLEYVCQALLGVERWNIELEEWKTAYVKENKLKAKKNLEGYGECPDEVLHPYSMGDVDYPRELIDRALEPGGLLDKDQFGNSSWVPYHTAMLSAHAFLEMEMTGIYVDRGVGRELTQLFQQSAAELLAEIQEMARWPTFNPGSQPDCRELLFGEEYARRKQPGPKRPKDGLSLYLTPVSTSGKPTKDWCKIKPHERELYTPSANKEVLGMLKGAHPIVEKLRNYRFVKQVLGLTLRPPTETEGMLDIDELGEYEYDGGLLEHVQIDGRVYTHLFPTAETGRVKCARPNLQQISSRREEDYARILGPRYKMPIRSMLVSTPPEGDSDPWVFVDFDLRGAELFVVAVQSGDMVMLDRCQRSNLPEDDPNYVDLHASVAVKAFRLDCPPTKSGLKKIGQVKLRIAAKTLLFGMIYSRGDEAVLRAIKEEGVEVTLEQVAQLRTAIFTEFPGLKRYLEACQGRVRLGWLRNCFGRLRRFPRTSDREIQAAMEREATNAPIQSAIVDVLHHWMHHLYHFPGRLDNQGRRRYRLLLQIHDALLVECRVSSLDWFVKDVIPSTLNKIQIYQCDLDGKRKPNAKPYTMGTEIKVLRSWGVDLSEDDAISLGIPQEYAVKK